MQTFYWIVEGALAGCSLPGGPGDGSRSEWEAREALGRDLDWLSSHGIRALLSLTETPLPPAALADAGLAGTHLPVDDLHPPAPHDLMAALAFIDQHRAAGRAVAVHCLVGEGRTGTVLAAYLIRGGETHEDAIQMLRALRPGAIGTIEQEHALRAFAQRRDWML
ncbi:MAG: dual specificity protein phosphatase family protein [Chloroflexota bacterium]